MVGPADPKEVLELRKVVSQQVLTNRERHEAAGQKGVENRHPTPEDIYLVIEVADATLNYDSGDKLRAYERGGIKEYWIIDVGKKAVDIYAHSQNQTAVRPLILGA